MYIHVPIQKVWQRGSNVDNVFFLFLNDVWHCVRLADIICHNISDKK